MYMQRGYETMIRSNSPNRRVCHLLRVTLAPSLLEKRVHGVVQLEPPLERLPREPSRTVHRAHPQGRSHLLCVPTLIIKKQALVILDTKRLPQGFEMSYLGARVDFVVRRHVLHRFPLLGLAAKRHVQRGDGQVGALDLRRPRDVGQVRTLPAAHLLDHPLGVCHERQFLTPPIPNGIALPTRVPQWLERGVVRHHVQLRLPHSRV
mmetsp:Transcript_13969/g.40087  ORF Transcript_13969/g.40087 Transcript_13969/m.40087 type:complete len:206 (+) Transcript_13969:1156-1773(+)